jgi:hypothetical protein
LYISLFIVNMNYIYAKKMLVHYFGIHIIYVFDYFIMTNAIIVYYYTSFIRRLIVTRVDDERSDECSNKTSVTVCLIKRV